MNSCPFFESADKTAQSLQTRYRVRLPIMVLAFGDNHDAAVPIPAGDVFDVVAVDRDDRFVIVDVKGEQFLIFETDLNQRAERSNVSQPSLR